MNRVNAVEFAVVADAADARGIGKDTALAVAHGRAVFPAFFPQPVHDLHVFLGDRIAILVAWLDL